MEVYQFGVTVEPLAFGEDMPEPAGYIDVRVTFDGKVFDYHTISLLELMRSGMFPGEYEILTCDCGHGICTGIYDGIVVLHDVASDTVRWMVPHPVSQRGGDFTANITMYRWIELGALSGYRESIASACDRALELFTSHIFPLEFCPKCDVELIRRFRHALAAPLFPAEERISYPLPAGLAGEATPGENGD